MRKKFELRQLNGCKGCDLARKVINTPKGDVKEVIPEKCIFGGLISGRSDSSVKFNCNRK